MSVPSRAGAAAVEIDGSTVARAFAKSIALAKGVLREHGFEAQVSVSRMNEGSVICAITLGPKQGSAPGVDEPGECVATTRPLGRAMVDLILGDDASFLT
jgi:hypothetical protein